MILVNISLSRIDKQYFFSSPKNSQKYMGMALIESKQGKDEYGNDGFVVQDVGKEQRAQGIKGPIIGNWKHVGRKPGGPTQQRSTPPARQEPTPGGPPPF